MKSIQLNHKREPRATIPTDITKSDDDKHFEGTLRGYYVENTNYYNIFPNNINMDAGNCSQIANVNPNKGNRNKQIIGFVLDKDLHKELSADEFNCITMLPQNTATPETFNEEGAQAKITGIQHSQTEDNGDAIDRLRMHLTRLYGYKLFTANASSNNNYERVPIDSIGENLLLGWWHTDTLHLIQYKSMKEVKQEPYALQMDVFSRNVGILESSVMMKKGAVIIGCGSVGSLVAVELAKSGLGRFFLIDNDIFGYHNICRHQCGMFDVGRYKTEALADRLRQINPYISIITKNAMVQEVDRYELEKFCDPGTIIIGGADNREGDLYASDFALEAGIPFVSIGCWERAFAGEIFYCLPNGNATYHDFMDAMGYVSGRVTQNRRFYTTEEELEKVSFMPGISADVDFVTLVGVKIILDLLNRDTKGYIQHVVPYLTQYTLVCNTNDPRVGGEQAEIFSYPLQVTRSIYIDQPDINGKY